MRATFADLKPSLLNFLLFSAYLILAATFLKFVFVQQFHIPGLSDLVAAI